MSYGLCSFLTYYRVATDNYNLVNYTSGLGIVVTCLVGLIRILSVSRGMFGRR